MRLRYALALTVSLMSVATFGETLDIPAEHLRDQIRGGLLGQMLGNLNGLPHEMKYIHEPGNVTSYTPALPDGARTDDDTDFEWVYIKVMQDENCLLLPPTRIAQLWKGRINTRIWCSNQYARQLMDLGSRPNRTELHDGHHRRRTRPDHATVHDDDRAGLCHRRHRRHSRRGSDRRRSREYRSPNRSRCARLACAASRQLAENTSTAQR